MLSRLPRCTTTRWLLANKLESFIFDHSVSIHFPLTLNPSFKDIIKNQNKEKKTSPEDDFDF